MLVGAGCSSDDGDVSRSGTTVQATAPESSTSSTSAPAESTTSEPTATTEVIPAGSTYVALGSSFAAGVGAGDTVDGVCAQGSENYARLVASELELEFIDSSCGGATIDNVVDTPQGDAPPQIESVPADAALVTVTVGGNDVNYIGNFFACGEGCPPGTIDDEASRNQRFADLTDELVAMLESIAERAPDAVIVLVAYPVLVEAPDDVCEGVLKADAAFQHDMGERLQQAFVDASDRAGVTFVDAYAASEGHGACRPPADRWMEGQTPIAGALPWHPNAESYLAQAELILTALG